MGRPGLGLAGLAAVPEVRLFAQQVQDFIEGPPMPDIPRRSSCRKHVWMIYAKDGFPTAENQGMMANVCLWSPARAWWCWTRAARCRSARWPSA
jgi:hypothetical protein